MLSYFKSATTAFKMQLYRSELQHLKCNCIVLMIPFQYFQLIKMEQVSFKNATVLSC
jgi:hypothetical protein